MTLFHASTKLAFNGITQRERTHLDAALGVLHRLFLVLIIRDKLRALKRPKERDIATMHVTRLYVYFVFFFTMIPRQIKRASRNFPRIARNDRAL